MRTVNFYNIDWDTDGEEIELPTDIILTVDEDFEIDLEGADLLSDEYGFCVNSFSFQELCNFKHTSVGTTTDGS